MRIGVQTMIMSWAQECGNGFPFPPPGNFAVLPQPEFFGDSANKRQWSRENPEFVIRVAEDGSLTVRRTGRGEQPVLELARHLRLPKRTSLAEAVVLLNGDGFEDRRLQNLQAQIRGLVSNRFVHHYERMVVPYAALQAASLDLGSIVPIHISADRRISRRVVVTKPPANVLKKMIPKPSKADRTNRRYEVNTHDFSFGRSQYRAMVRNYNAPGTFQMQVMHHPEFSPEPSWHFVEDAAAEEWTIVERIHRLGEAVFHASGPDGRHRWISGFDQQEDPAMYYLAQLPDGGGIRYITHALKALAPPIVHRARRDGRRVFRQGDIFAVETDLTDDDMLGAGHSIVRRDSLFEGPRVLPFTSTDRGYRLRKKIMIYGTGHTASQVCVTNRGTFIKGSMFHDPVLENLRANREPEHSVVELGDEVWFLAVRNTVPRQTSSDSN